MIQQEKVDDVRTCRTLFPIVLHIRDDVIERGPVALIFW